MLPASKVLHRVLAIAQIRSLGPSDLLPSPRAGMSGNSEHKQRQSASAGL